MPAFPARLPPGSVVVVVVVVAVEVEVEVPLTSSSRKFRMSGLTISLASRFISSILRSKRLRISRVYKESEDGVGWTLRNRLMSSCDR